MCNRVTLAIEKITKQYIISSRRSQAQVLRALDKVSFSLSPGLYGLLGPNGAGKSTLINIITGNLAPDSGRVLWNGKSARNRGKNYRRILGYMPQQQTLYEAFSGRRFLQYICSLKEIPRVDINAEVERVARAVNLWEEMDKRLSAYSGGMKQRLLAAAAIIGKPRLIIMDEPTAGLDPKERVRFRNLMKGYAENSIVLLATHVVSDIEPVADGVILLRRGKIAMMDSPQNLVRQTPGCGNLEDVYLSVFGEEDETGQSEAGVCG